jgi:hypothetical protein
VFFSVYAIISLKRYCGKGNVKIKKDVHMSRDLLKNTILALLSDAPGLGEIQLRKALVMIDILNDAYYGKGLTGAVYLKFPHGPVPDEGSMKVIWGMVKENLIYMLEEPVGRYTKHAYYKRQEPDYNNFTGDQISFIQAAARFALKNTAKNLSELTHDKVYKGTPMGEVIPLSAMSSIRIKVPRRLSKAQRDEIRNALDADSDFIFGSGAGTEAVAY